MTKLQFLKRYNISEAQFIGAKKIESSLDLRCLTAIPAGLKTLLDLKRKYPNL